MKTYIGIKIVQAKPAVRLHPTANDPLCQDDGYRVRYEDGYESWSPKAVFDAAYLEVGAEQAETLEGELRSYLLFGGIPVKTTGPLPIASDDFELRKAALDYAIKSRSLHEYGPATVERARVFYDFLAGVPVAPAEPDPVSTYASAHAAIRNASGTVEMVGAHPLLTEVTTLLGKARDKLEEWFDELEVPAPGHVELPAFEQRDGVVAPDEMFEPGAEPALKIVEADRPD